MKIRLNPLGKQIGPTQPQPPANYGYASIAQMELDNVVSSANMKYEEAMKVDGVPFLLWRKRYEGHSCTCQFSSAAPIIPTPAAPAAPVVNPPKLSAIKVRGSWDDQNTKPNVVGKELGVVIGEFESDRGQTNDIKEFDTVTTFSEEDDAWFHGISNDIGLFGNTAVPCGICFGTKFSNGYSLFRGLREVFDTVNRGRTSGFTIDDSTRPSSFVAPAGRKNLYVEWRYELPTYFLNFISFSVRNNLQAAEGVVLQYRLVGTSGAFVNVTNDFMQSRRNQGGKFDFRVVSTGESETDTVRFTHVEMVFQFADWPKTQIPQLQKSTTFNTIEPIFQSEFPLPPSIDTLNESDVIHDLKYDEVWLITDVTDYMTARRQVLAWTATVRSQTPFDTLSLLRIPFNPHYNIAYKGLEYMAGTKDYGEDNL